jgi:hypothetical protein
LHVAVEKSTAVWDRAMMGRRQARGAGLARGELEPAGDSAVQ